MELSEEQINTFCSSILIIDIINYIKENRSDYDLWLKEQGIIEPETLGKEEEKENG